MNCAAVFRRIQISQKFYPNQSLKCLTALAVISTGLISGVTAQESSLKTEELIITATRLPRTIDDIAGTVSVISAADIEHQLADDLDDLVRFQPGVTMNTSARGGNQGFSIRGIGGNRVLTVIDGVRSSDIYAAGPSSYGKDSFEVDDLKSVEIIRGPASVLYGADAMGGVVLLNTKGPRDYLGADSGSYFNISSSLDSADEQKKLGFTGAYQAGSFGVVTQFTHREFQEHDVAGSGKLNPQDGDSDGLLIKTYWDLTESQQLIFTLDSYTENNEIDLISDLGTSVTESFGEDETERDRISLVYHVDYEAAVFDSFDLSLHQQTTDALQRTRQDRVSYSFLNPVDSSTYGGTSARRNTDFEFNQKTVAVGLNLRKTIQQQSLQHSIAYGFNYDKTETERPRNRCDEQLSTGLVTCNIAAYPFAPTENFPNKTFPDSETRRTGLYIQDEISFENIGLTLIPGIRHDRYKMQPSIDSLLDSSGIIESFGGFQVEGVDEGATSISLGAIYEVSDRISAFAQYSEGYRPPNFDESNQAFVNLGFGYATVPNPDLDAESSKGLEIGMRLNTDNMFVSLAAYQNRYEDFIDSAFVGMEGSISLYQDRNIGKVKIIGAELVSTWYLTDEWQLRGSFAYAHGDNQEADIPLDSVDPLTAVVGLRFDSAQGRWGGELMLTATDDKDRVSSNTVVTADSYQVVDLLAYYNLSDSSTVRVGFFNLFDSEYARWSNIKGLTATSLTSIANAQQAGATFRVGFNYQF
ncbi:MAG: hypothetical protein COA96_08975 [SAR86 cluster bacterium]|uniref:TonB-dependent receptor n=1 Tax=SAR86 cluster bacterium TaxID=2030880 RepID=A0A2A5B0N1_9GAMM|nr:MAG: hypothetical protein COA96_08975 [SAR86 cluster bacterium]